MMRLVSSCRSRPKVLNMSSIAVLALILCMYSSERSGVMASVAPPEMPVGTRGMDEMIPSGKRLTTESMYQNMRKMEYAVRGKVVIAADLIQNELSKQQESDDDDDKYDFDHIVYTNIGNPQSVGQKPLTWPRQVLALVDLPKELGIDHPDATKLFPSDAIDRAREIKDSMAHGSSGCYSHSKGISKFRDEVAAFVTKRDQGLYTDPEDIYLTNGASAGIVMVLNSLIADPSCGIMIPIPQYPIYSATIDLQGGHRVGYNLDEEKGWDLNVEELERSITEAREQGINVVAFVLINPGNPTGQVLSKKSVKEVVKFCAKQKLVLLSDEVYQENVYDDTVSFVSCKRAAHETGLLKKDALELISFHSTSKGVFGECGRRGGYMELVGIDPDVKDVLYKLASSSLCSSVSGQTMTSLMVRGPPEDGESYQSHENEKRDILASLRTRSKIVNDGLNSIPGFSCQPAKGAMYSFPRVELPAGAVTAALAENISPDTLYALSLLDRTGICVVPASGFGQKPGRYGFRTTFLPPEDEMKRCVELIRIHHEEFCARYS